METDFFCELYDPNIVIGMIFDILEAHGLKPRHPTQQNGYFLSHCREYDISDYEACEYLVAWGSHEGELGKSISYKNSREYIPERFFSRKRFVDMMGTGRVIVSDDVRNLMQESGFKDIEYDPAPQRSGKASLQPTRLWEVKPLVTMPPMSSRCTFHDEKGNIVCGSNTEGYCIYEEYWQPPEYYYHRCDLDSITGVDLALTFELFGTNVRKKDVIVSKRFYQFCKSLDLTLDWIPVRIDDGQGR